MAVKAPMRTIDNDRILEYDEVNWPENRLLPLFLPPAKMVSALDLNAAKLSSQERIMFYGHGQIGIVLASLCAVEHKAFDFVLEALHKLIWLVGAGGSCAQVMGAGPCGTPRHCRNPPETH